jgi:N,N'-diacetyllegionaminate synthase
VLLSSGLATLAEMAVAKAAIEAEWDKAAVVPGLAIMHCVSAYPAEAEDANLGAIRTLTTLGATVGYSDHTLGIQAAVLSVGLGARVIEKHFTLDNRQSDFRDHQLSSDPVEFVELVKGVRHAEIMLGDGEKRPLPCESAVATAARRSLHLARDLHAGAVIADRDLICLRPAGGISASKMDSVIGRRIVKSLAAGSRLEVADLD